MSRTRKKKKLTYPLLTAVLLMLVTAILVALLLTVALSALQDDTSDAPTSPISTTTVLPVESTVSVSVPTVSSTEKTTVPETPGTEVTDTPPTPSTTVTVTKAPETTPKPASTTKAPETEPPVVQGEYKIDMTDYMDAIDPAGDLWDDAYLLLVNADHPITNNQEKEYAVLKGMKTFSSSSDYKYKYMPGLSFNETALKALTAMFKEAAADGITDLDVTSAYRSYDKQASIFNSNCNKTYHWVCADVGCNVDWIGKDSTCPICGKKTSQTMEITREEKEANVATYSCAPGTSDHQTGLAVDIIQTSLPSRFNALIQEFGTTEAGKWLAANCHRFGFILRFPADKEDITGIIYEPWHFRYVGRTHAAAMNEMNLCLEEYVEYLTSTGYFN